MGKPIDTSSQVDTVLEQTEIGSFIAKYKTSVIALVILIIAGVVGFGVYKGQMDKKRNAYAAAVYKFEKNDFNSFKEDKIDSKLYVEKFNVLSLDVNWFDGFFPLTLKSIDLLSQKNKSEEALEMANTSFEKFDNPTMRFLIGVRRAALFENAKAPKKAIEVLENILKTQAKVMEPKIYLDLGRLYIVTGDKEKAKSNLQYSIDNSNDENLKKMARAFLTEI